MLALAMLATTNWLLVEGADDSNNSVVVTWNATDGGV